MEAWDKQNAGLKKTNSKVYSERRKEYEQRITSGR